MSISTVDLNTACEALQSAWSSLKTSNTRGTCPRWLSVKIVESFGTRCLRITRELDCGDDHEFGNRNHNEDAVAERDDEALIRIEQKKDACVVLFDVIHSPSYQVPVLYVNVKACDSHSRTPTLTDIYQRLLPVSKREQMQSVGVMGALSMTDHPMSGLPCWFVHPCRTAETMERLRPASNAVNQPVDYLLMWMGVVGASVGLDVSIALAEAMSKARS